MSNDGEKPKLHLHSWENICKPKSCGGLGLSSLKGRNSAFLFKWWWKCCEEKGKLWNKLLQHKYGRDFFTRLPSLLNDNASSYILKSFIEFGMSSIEKGCFSHIFRWSVGQGSRILFWEDYWCGSKPLKEEFPRLYGLSCLKFSNLLTFRSVWLANTNQWCGIWKRPLRAWEEIDSNTLGSLVD